MEADVTDDCPALPPPRRTFDGSGPSSLVRDAVVQGGLLHHEHEPMPLLMDDP